MNTTTFELPQITPLAAGQTEKSYPAVSTPRASLCRDAINRELVLCAQGQGDTAPSRWEQWLLAPVVIASMAAILTAATTAGELLTQWPAFVGWAEQILR